MSDKPVPPKPPPPKNVEHDTPMSNKGSQTPTWISSGDWCHLVLTLIAFAACLLGIWQDMNYVLAIGLVGLLGSVAYSDIIVKV